MWKTFHKWWSSQVVNLFIAVNWECWTHAGGLCFLAMHPGTGHLSYRSVLAGSHVLKLSHLIVITPRAILPWSVVIGYICKSLWCCIMCQFEVNVLEADITAWVRKVQNNFDSQKIIFTEMYQITYSFWCWNLNQSH